MSSLAMMDLVHVAVCMQKPANRSNMSGQTSVFPLFRLFSTFSTTAQSARSAVTLYYSSVYSLEITNEISLSIYDPTLEVTSSCAGLGFDYYDSTLYQCKTCPSHQTKDSSYKNGVGDAISNGNCTSYNCTSCASQGLASFSDNSGCVGCDSTTTGLQASTGDCACASGKVLIERDVVGNKLTNKTCLSCPTGTLVVTSDTVIAGKSYTGSRYQCQSCPDPLMTMSLVNGVYSCKCPTGYTITGVSGIGEQSCILTTLASSFLSLVTTASAVSYSQSGITVNSLTIQHYYVSAVSYCTFYGKALDSTYCQILANLCVLQLYDQSTIPCSNHLSIAGSRSSVNNPNNIDRWVNGMPWLYYTQSFTGDEVCKQEIYNTKMSLRNTDMSYVVASYTMNGTFMGFSDLDNLLGFCTVQAPDSNRAFTSTKWQKFAHDSRYSYSCDLAKLFEKEQLFYEIFLYDSTSNKYAPVPIKVLPYSGTRPTFSAYDLGSPCDTADKLVRRFFLYDIVSGISNVNNYPEVIRYASYLGVVVTMVKGKQTSIYPSVFVVEYTDIALDSWSTVSSSSSAVSSSTSSSSVNSVVTMATSFALSKGSALRGKDEEEKEVKERSASEDEGRRRLLSFPTSSPLSITSTGKVEFEAAYTTDVTTFLNTQLGVFIGAVVIAAIMFLIRYNNWRRRNSRLVTAAALSTSLGAVNLKNLLELAIVFLHCYTLVLFPFIVLVSWYFFVFFKLQSVPSLLLPPYNNTMSMFSSDSAYQFWVMHIYILTFSQIAYVFLKLVYNQSHADMFLIDWEPMRDSPTHDKKGHNARFLQQEEAGLTVDRSLDDGPPDVQTFQIFLSAEWRAEFNKHNVVLTQPLSLSEFINNRRMQLQSQLSSAMNRPWTNGVNNISAFSNGMVMGFQLSNLRKGGMSRLQAQKMRESTRISSGLSIMGLQSYNVLPNERVISAWKEMNNFLTNFVDNSFSHAGLKRSIREPSYYEKTFCAGPDLTLPEQPSILLTDRDLRYTNVLFLGN
eukprot:scaffold2338_cov184-Ochromonas_danica.AAC.1